jgi:hypothetical protein
MLKRLPFPMLLCALLLLVSFAMPAAAQTDLLEITVNAGFDGRYRGNMWMPLFVRVRNDGDAVSGRLVVRPETSGSVVDNTFSTAIELPSGARKSTTLYIIPSGFGQQVRVELIDNNGNVRASSNARIQGMNILDTLYVVVTAAASGSVDLTGVRTNGYEAYQANWSIEHLPTYAAALQAVDLMFISDIDTGTLTQAQRDAVSDWVAAGGHLIVTGGANWQATAAGLRELLPFEPTGSALYPVHAGLARWSQAVTDNNQNEADSSTLVATGTTKDGAQVLVEAGENVPLIVRRSYGSGVVDYLAADPNALPLRGWTGLDSVWFALISSREPLPSWGHSYTNWVSAQSATQIIPGFNLLPDTLALCGFLALYIALIGPLNYFLLNRLNRREYAWFSIPALILIFSTVAWVTGFNLRGTDVTLNRMTLIQTWSDVERARVDGLVGLLAPRRANYTVTLDDGIMLRTVPQQGSTGPFSAALAGPDIQQSDLFQAFEFPVDASFIAGFNASGTMPRPDIGGQASLTFIGEELQTVRGAVSNASEWTLVDPLLLARGTAHRLDADLLPGDTVTFDFELTPEDAPAAQRVDTSPRTIYYYSSSFDYATSEQSMLDILGEDVYNTTAPYYYGYGSYYNNPNDPNWQENTRRRAFLSSFLTDYFSSTGRGDRVYLVGWAQVSPEVIEVPNVTWRTQDLTLVVVELETQVVPSTSRVTISSDRFTWITRYRDNINAIGPYNLTMYTDGEIIFRFTPLPDAVLSRVDRLVLFIDSDNLSAGVTLELWNWDERQWEAIEVGRSQFSIPNPARYLGPQNAVEIRVARQPSDLSLNIRSLWIEQRGSY